ncbi:MAG: hypothetical protein KJ955_06995 [Nanoarchaeota archaeon]|nr:hypothetical protein [Nanoarchaeota archaeon]
MDNQGKIRIVTIGGYVSLSIIIILILTVYGLANPQQLPFFEDFETGVLTENWTVWGDMPENWHVRGEMYKINGAYSVTAYTGGPGAATSYLEINLTQHDIDKDIQIDYKRNTMYNSPQNKLDVLWFDGSWHTLEAGVYGYAEKTHRRRPTLTDISLRFKCYTAGQGRCTIDDVNVRDIPPDNAPPIITIISPQNTTYNYSTSFKALLNFTTDEEATCNYSLNGANNISLGFGTSFTMIVMGINGSNRIDVNCVDTVGNVNSNNVSFILQKMFPPIPFFEDFETGILSENWTVGGNMQKNWHVFQPFAINGLYGAYAYTNGASESFLEVNLTSHELNKDIRIEYKRSNMFNSPQNKLDVSWFDGTWHNLEMGVYGYAGKVHKRRPVSTDITLRFKCYTTAQGSCSLDDVNVSDILPEAWVDDDYCPSCNNDEKEWGYYAFNTIQLAVDSVQNGTTIHVNPGIYRDPINITSRANLAIVGTDKNSVINDFNNTYCWNTASYGCTRKAGVRVVSSSNITLNNMTFEGGEITGNWGTMFFFWDSDGIIKDNYAYNISLSDDSGYYTEIIGYLRSPNTVKNVLISGNEFKNPGRSFVCNDYQNCTFINNLIYKTIDDFGYGIELGSLATGTVINNTIWGYDTKAASDSSTSTAIYVHSLFSQGITSELVKDITIKGNNLYENQAGIWIGSDWSTLVGNVTIIGVIEDNWIHDNICQNCDNEDVVAGIFAVDDGKSVGSSVNVTFANNILNDNSRYGYFIFTYGDGELHLAINNETITGNPQANIKVVNFGENATSLYDVNITNSRIYNSTLNFNNMQPQPIYTIPNWWGSSPPIGIYGTEYDPWYSDYSLTTLTSFPPKLRLYNPENISYITNNLALEYYANDKTLDKIWFTVKGGFRGYLTGNTTFRSPQGDVTLIIYANDTYGATNSSAVSFFVDSKKPRAKRAVGKEKYGKQDIRG